MKRSDQPIRFGIFALLAGMLCLTFARLPSRTTVRRTQAEASDSTVASVGRSEPSTRSVASEQLPPRNSTLPSQDRSDRHQTPLDVPAEHLEQIAGMGAEAPIVGVPAAETTAPWGDLYRAELPVWRLDFRSQRQDDEWTREMKQEMTEQAAALAVGIDITDLSCRETFCRMYLSFATRQDAAQFTQLVATEPEEYQFRRLVPELDANGVEASDHTHELMVKRSRPSHLPPSDAVLRTRDPGPDGIELTVAAEQVTAALSP
jgi:hypothetical protein